MRKRAHARHRGFTLLEMLIVVAIAGVLMAFGIPVLRGTLVQAQMVSFGTEIQSAFQRARFEAIKLGFPVVVQLQPDDRRVRAYVDVPAFAVDGSRTDNPLLLEPEAGLQQAETDRVLFEIGMPNAVELNAPAGEDLVDGMTNLSGGPPADASPDELVLVFNTNGAVAALGAFRFGARGSSNNFLEARVEFASTGKSTLRKWDCADSVWRYRDEEVVGRKAWKWYSTFASC